MKEVNIVTRKLWWIIPRPDNQIVTNNLLWVSYFSDPVGLDARVLPSIVCDYNIESIFNRNHFIVYTV